MQVLWVFHFWCGFLLCCTAFPPHSISLHSSLPPTLPPLSLTLSLSHSFTHSLTHSLSLSFFMYTIQEYSQKASHEENFQVARVPHLQLLTTEIFETKFDLNQPFMKDIFIKRSITYNISHGNDTQLPKVRATS